jgi:hypothetical protein
MNENYLHSRSAAGKLESIPQEVRMQSRSPVTQLRWNGATGPARAGATPAEHRVLTAIRLFFRPACRRYPASALWHAVLYDAGLGASDIDRFARFLEMMARNACLPLDIRCRCSAPMGGSETLLLDTVALLQRGRLRDAVETLAAALPLDRLEALTLSAWDAASTLADAGLILPERSRKADYLH